MAYRGIKRSFIDFQRHPWLHIISVATIAMALLILGVFFLGYRNMESIADKAKSQITATVYLKDGLTEAQVTELKERILSLGMVKNAVFKSRHSVMEELSSFLGSGVGDSLTGNEIFPDILEVEVRREASMSDAGDVKTMVSKMPEVADVDFSEDWLAQFKHIRQMFQVFGFCLTSAILIGCGFIIANFMGMRHQARKNEIEIVRLHGASQQFVMAPFLWEGFFEGIIGAFIALILLYVAKIFLGAMVSSQWASLLGVHQLLYLSIGQLFAVIALGIAMAFFGSFTVFIRFQENGYR